MPKQIDYVAIRSLIKEILNEKDSLYVYDLRRRLEQKGIKVCNPVIKKATEKLIELGLVNKKTIYSTVNKKEIYYVKEYQERRQNNYVDYDVLSSAIVSLLMGTQTPIGKNKVHVLLIREGYNYSTFSVHKCLLSLLKQDKIQAVTNTVIGKQVQQYYIKTEDKENEITRP